MSSASPATTRRRPPPSATPSRPRGPRHAAHPRPIYLGFASRFGDGDVEATNFAGQLHGEEPREVTENKAGVFAGHVCDKVGRRMVAAGAPGECRLDRDGAREAPLVADSERTAAEDLPGLRLPRADLADDGGGERGWRDALAKMQIYLHALNRGAGSAPASRKSGWLAGTPAAGELRL